MLIAQISDTHLIVDGPGSARRLADFQAVIDDINALDPLPDAIVHTGDIVHNGLAREYAAATAILDRARAPVYVLAGNKDNRSALRAAFQSGGYLSADQSFISYTVDAFPFRLVALDTTDPESKKGAFCDARFAALEGYLQSDRPALVFMHHPPVEITVGPDRFHFDDLARMERLARCLSSHTPLRAVMCGHVHRATTAMLGQVPVSVMSSVATELRWDTQPAGTETRPAYQLLEAEPTTGSVRISTRYVP